MSSASPTAPAGALQTFCLEMKALETLARKDRKRKAVAAVLGSSIAALSTFFVVEATRTSSATIWSSVPIAAAFSLLSYSSCKRRIEDIGGSFLCGLVHLAAFLMGLRLILGYQTWWIGPIVGFDRGKWGYGNWFAFWSFPACHLDSVGSNENKFAEQPRNPTSKLNSSFRPAGDAS